ncbi:pilus assembly PilX N-terminal domain-containing protein [Crassaminicella indica]|uniref:Pilus assembly PilX N-terminal domain-containing protein n=1 Tax=Crassaminicella indica TaxID=2855394 RepID=A0ABX8RAB6_9CLOT|nr:pilus assembly PilX N-terminal domain-containing protein [Crassaminicella indica]QXM06000.1 pilus assembly PilX N-terminal domain-containing protein [Crassaminicella indica]
MIKKIFTTKRGSALILVLIVLTILSILGISILTLSMSNYKIKITDQNVKTAFYLAESGLEEAYAKVGKVIEAGINEGNKKVKVELEKFIENEKQKEKDESNSYDSPYIKDDGSIDEKYLEKNLENEINQWFKDQYIDYINKNLKDCLKDYTVVDTAIDKSKPKIKIIGKPILFKKTIKIVGDQPTTVYNKYQITLHSTFTHKKISQKIKCTFTIDVPSYHAPYYIKKIMAQANDNILWKKAITTEKNLYLEGNSIKIKGDIYAFGGEEKEHEKDKKGIIVKNNNTIIEGNVATNQYIYPSADNASLTIKNGDIYCNTLFIPSNAKNCTVIVNNGSVNTKDDIELNGKAGKIEIYGSYYGFSDGRNDPGHHKSSSIVINNTDIGNNSWLKITGTQVDDHDKDARGLIGNNYSENKPGVVIAGTVYISDVKDSSGKDYQTGESVSVKGNYIAYSKHLKYNSKRDERFNPDNIIIKYFSPLFLADEYKIISENGVENGDKYDVFDKSKYFEYYNKDFGGLNLGEDNGISIKNVIHSTGAYIDNGHVHSSIIQIENIHSLLKSKAEDYKYYINKMADPKMVRRAGDKREFTALNTRTRINDIFEFKAEGLNINGKQFDNISKIDLDTNELVFINNNKNKSISIIGKNAKISKGDYKVTLKDTNLNGIIITKGDVYITGEINYRGTIIAQGNIYIQDYQPKTITSDRSYILKKIYEISQMDNDIADQLKNEFNNECSFLYELEIGIPNEDDEDKVNSFLKYENIIDLHWEKE